MKTALHSILILGMISLGGCLSKPSLRKESFAFVTPSVENAAAPGGPVLAIRRIFVAPPFDAQALTYRTGPFTYERDPYAEFLTSPADALAEPVRAYFRKFFSDVTESGSGRRAGIHLEVTVSQLYGDFRDRDHPTAVLRMRFLALATNGSAPGKVVWQKECARDIPLKARSAAALVEGWNEALKQIATEAAQDLRTAAVK